MTKTILTCLMFSMTVLQPALAGGGSEIGNGGDRFAIEFIATAYKVVDDLGILPANVLPFDIKLFETAIGRTQVESTDQPLLLNGAVKDAINYPEATPPRIIFSRQGWEQTEGFRRRKLVLHEYLGILRVDDSNYQVTSKIYNKDPAGIPCAGDEENLTALALAKWRSDGLAVTESNIEGRSGSSTLGGDFIAFVRGYVIKKGKWVQSLLFAGQCNSQSGRYTELPLNSLEVLSPVDLNCKGKAARFCSGR